MVLILKNRTACILVSICLFSTAFIRPASARLFSFLFDKTIDSEQYSAREDSINAYNEQAIELFEEGHFEEAQELWEKAIEIMETTEPLDNERDGQEDVYDSADVEEMVAPVLQKDNDVDEMYAQAVSLFKKQRYVASKKLFERVEAMIPDHKATRNYLSILEHKIKQTQQTLSGDVVDGNYYSRQAEREEWSRILEESERELKKKIMSQVAPLYEKALKYYKERKFKLAKDYFEEIDGISPGYKDTTKYLARVDADIKEEKQLLAKEEYRKKYLARKQEHEEWQRVIAESEKKLHEQLLAQAEPIYQEALQYYKQREFELAKAQFEEVQMIVPDYKSVSKYLGRIDQDIQKEMFDRRQEEARELARQQKEEEIRRQREQERLARLEEEKNRLRIEQFKEEVAARRREREEWLKVIAQAEKERDRKLQAQAEFIYDEAVDYYKKRDFKKAKDDFKEVEAIIPNYKSTTKYLARIDKDIEEELRVQMVERQRLLQRKMREEQYADLKKREKEEAMRALESERRLLEFKEHARIRKEKREEWDEILAKNERERQRKLEEEAEFIYKEALSAYKQKDWDRARSTFIEVSEVLPAYKSTDKYIERIDRNIKKEEARVQREIAKAKEEQRRKEVLARKQEEERQKELALADKKREEEYNETQADIAYRLALSLYEREKFNEAKDKFLEVEQYVPGFKATKRYLARIDADMQRTLDLKQRQNELAAQRQAREDEIARETEIRKMMQLEEARRIKEMKIEAKQREEERLAWEHSVKKIEEEQKRRLEEQTDSVYREALRYYQAGWYDQALATFREVQSAIPGYRSTDKYMAKVSKKIEDERREHLENERKIREQTNDQIASDEEDLQRAEAWRQELAAHKREKMAAENQRGRAQLQNAAGMVNDQAVSLATDDHERAVADQAEIKYRQALDAYSRNKFIEAKLKFIEVESTSPGYKATLKYLSHIDEKIEKQKARFDKERAKADKQRHNLISNALLQEEKAHRSSEPDSDMPVAPEIKTVKRVNEGNWEQRLNNRRKALRDQRREARREFDKRFREMYDRAVNLYRGKSYEEAKNLFLQIERMRPGYKRAASYIKKSNAKIAKGLQQKVHAQVVQTRQNHSRSRVVNAALDAFE